MDGGVSGPLVTDSILLSRNLCDISFVIPAMYGRVTYINNLQYCCITSCHLGSVNNLLAASVDGMPGPVGLIEAPVTIQSHVGVRDTAGRSKDLGRFPYQHVASHLTRGRPWGLAYAP